MKKYSVIVIDPPWAASDKLTMSKTPRGAAANYKTLSIKDLESLPINKISNEKGTVLALWCLGSMLQEALDLMKAWGFKQKQTLCWVKTKKHINKFANTPMKENLAFGMGRLFRQTHEICLIGVNNTGVYKKLKNRSQRSVCFDLNKGHSIKPELLQDSLDLMFPEASKIEIFARRERKGWVTIGNEVGATKGEDITKSLNDIINGSDAIPSLITK